MKLFTIGFTKKSARQFFELLRASGAKRVLEVRLNNVSQLAGFAKKEDLGSHLVGRLTPPSVTSAKNAATSAASSSGASSAAKCPPRGISVQRRTS